MDDNEENRDYDQEENKIDDDEKNVVWTIKQWSYANKYIDMNLEIFKNLPLTQGKKKEIRSIVETVIEEIKSNYNVHVLRLFQFFLFNVNCDLDEIVTEHQLEQIMWVKFYIMIWRLGKDKLKAPNGVTLENVRGRYHMKTTIATHANLCRLLGCLLFT